MLAMVKHEYILQTVDKPLLELERVSPNRLVIVILGGFFGGVLACLIVVLGFNFLSSRNEQ
jgi:LPS O-antigen subunit length determinant protein (WzzB/FepE family)